MTADAAYIPTPDATGIIDNYDALYPMSVFVEPSTYIRFSDTVEDVTGAPYTMDEEDRAFLEHLNARFASAAAHGHDSGSSPADAGRALRSPRKDKGKEAAAPVALSEDDFELVMTQFEAYAEDRYPALHTVRCCYWVRRHD
jgi:enhancer of polycomb-like protein